MAIASKASPSSHPTMSGMNLRLGCLHRAGDNTKGTRNPGKLVNHRKAGAPGPRRTSDPGLLRMTLPSLLKGNLQPSSGEAGTKKLLSGDILNLYTTPSV